MDTKEEYAEYLENEKQALRNCFMKTRVLPGIPIVDVADVLSDVFSKEELNALIEDLTFDYNHKYYPKLELKGGEVT